MIFFILSKEKKTTHALDKYFCSLIIDFFRLTE